MTARASGRFAVSAVVAAALACGLGDLLRATGQGRGGSPPAQTQITITDALGRQHTRTTRITQAHRAGAAKRRKALLAKALTVGTSVEAAGTTTTPPETAATTTTEKGPFVAAGAEALQGPPPVAQPGGVPDYFGLAPNWAFSPLPLGPIASVTITVGGSGYSSGATASVSDAYGTGEGAELAVQVAGGVVTSITVLNAGANYVAPVVSITDTSGQNAEAQATLNTSQLTGGIRKFRDGLPGLGPAKMNNLGQYIPVAIPEQWCDRPEAVQPCRPADYYEIELGEYSEKMHSDLPPTRLRGYRQINTNDVTVSRFHYLGPAIVARKGIPVRVKFTNRLPVGAAGRLFLPVDPTVMGAGPGPSIWNGTQRADSLCPTSPGAIAPGCYTENRATLHLHGGVTPWISDGSVHSWITPAGESTNYPKGVSVYPVPDMPDPGAGAQTFFYTNDQSARLMFVEDRSRGITRLNVYAGETAPYLLRDVVEDELVARGIIPPDEIPLIIQDKTFVDANTVRNSDPTWNWGTGALDSTGVRATNTGDLWWPHVYMPAQNWYDMTGVNPMGRWAYGPWFFPPTLRIPYGPVPNPYFGTFPWEPPEMPGTPNTSIVAEAFLDTPIVNGTAYPTLTVQPRAYRFRILNAASDRFWNLQMYKADATRTEVKMVPAISDPLFPYWPTDNRVGGVPDPATAGPNWIQVGTEGGFLPKPVVVQNQPITWNTDPTTFNLGNVVMHSLLLAPAERADVIVDFSQFAGQTLILYNDAPAAFPASDPRLDYYTGKPDHALGGDGTGGSPTTYPGYGPNTRTIMQITVAGGSPAPLYDVNILRRVWNPADDRTDDSSGDPIPPLPPGFPPFSWSPKGVFEHAQDPIIVGQGAYDYVYADNPTFPRYWPTWGVARIQDSAIGFETVEGTTLGGPSNPNLPPPPPPMPLQPKALHDEMGAAYDDYGRMNSRLGLEIPVTTNINQNVVLQEFADPPTEFLKLSPAGSTVQSGDGTQIWKITHNGVDTHPLHFGPFQVQLINRVGWDGQIRLPDANELGWKDTVRVSPLEDTIVALRPTAPAPERLPFRGVPNSERYLEPALQPGSTFGFTNVDPLTGQNLQPPTTNIMFNFGWEYAWQATMGSHADGGMMRPIVLSVPPDPPPPPSNLVAQATGGGVVLTWTPPAQATSVRLQRATGPSMVGAVVVTTVPSTVQTWTDVPPASGTYFYTATAITLVGGLSAESLPTSPVSVVYAGGPVLEVAPAALRFTSTLNVRSLQQMVTVQNTGTAPLTINGIPLGGPNASQFNRTHNCPTNLAANATCTVTVWFRPTTLSPVTKTATLTVNVAAPAVPQTVSLTGVVPFTVAPTSIDFGERGVSAGPTGWRTVRVYNSGTEVIRVGTIGLTGANPGQFQINPLTPTCGTLNPGSYCPVNVRFDPTTTGSKSATLTVPAEGLTERVALRGTGTR